MRTFIILYAPHKGKKTSRLWQRINSKISQIFFALQTTGKLKHIYLKHAVYQKNASPPMRLTRTRNRQPHEKSVSEFFLPLVELQKQHYERHSQEQIK